MNSIGKLQPARFALNQLPLILAVTSLAVALSASGEQRALLETETRWEQHAALASELDRFAQNGISATEDAEREAALARFENTANELRASLLEFPNQYVASALTSALRKYEDALLAESPTDLGEDLHAQIQSGRTESAARLHAAMENGLTPALALLAAVVSLLFTSGFRSRELRRAIRNERSLLEAKQQAEAATEAKSGFLANMSHEIRTPLNAVLGLTELVSKTELDSEQREFVSTIQTSGESLLQIINGILDFSKIEAGHLELANSEFDLRGVVENVGDLLATRAEQNGLQLIADIEPGVPKRLRGDAGRLRQVLLNLATNAIKFTEAGEIVIRVRNVSDHADAELLFEVQDTGIGIGARKLKKLFHSFTQVDTSTARRYTGTGLGLSISKSIVEAMHGEIAAESVKGKGTIFWFTAQFERASHTGPGDEIPQALENARVLVVDDSETVRTSLARFIDSVGLRTHAMADAKDALACLRSAAAEGDAFRILILEHSSSGESLRDVLHQIDSDATLEPRIILTGSFSSRSSSNGNSELSAAFITKPVKQSALVTALCETCGQRAPTNARANDSAQVPLPADARILLVEDDLVNQKVAVKMLERIGLEPDAARNGLEALEAVKSTDYDLILMDCRMPKMDGFEATREIRRLQGHSANIPIVAMTALAQDSDREKCIAAGMDDHLTKPVRLQVLREVVTRWLAPAPLTNEAETKPIPSERSRVHEA